MRHCGKSSAESNAHVKGKSMSHAETLRQLADLIDENETLRNKVSILELELQQTKSRPVNEEPEWYTPTEAAKYIRCKKTFLGRDRAKKKPEIPHSKLGHRTLRYNKVDLDAWIASKRKSA